MSDTPRTDALVDEGGMPYDADFARQLERELAAANAQLVTKTDELAAMSKMYAAVTIILEEMQREQDIETMIDRLTVRQQREYALKCARRVQHLMRDPRSIAVLDTRERWLRGEATGEEMDAAWRAATLAAWDAEKEKEEAAASACRAALAAACGAGRVAALAAARAAAGAETWDARWSSERAWQREELERMLGEGGGA